MRETRSRTSSGPRRFMGGAAIATNRTAASWLALSVSKSIRRISLVRCSAWPSRRSEVHGNGPKSIPSTGNDPGWVEPSVRRAVIGEPRDVPMADERGVGGPDRGASADVDHAVGIAGNHVCRLLAGAYRHDGAVRVGKSRDGVIGCGTEQDDVAARQLEETLDVRGVFRVLRAFPRHAPVEAELTAPTDGAHGTNIRHRSDFPRRAPKQGRPWLGGVCRVWSESSSHSGPKRPGQSGLAPPDPAGPRSADIVALA